MPQIRVLHQARAGVDRARAHAAHHAVDGGGILPDENAREFFYDLGEAGSEKRLAVAGNLLVGLDLDDGPVEVGLDHRGGNVCDLHSMHYVIRKAARSCAYWSTGAQGCIGSWVVKGLLDRHLEVLMFDLDASPHGCGGSRPPELIARAEVRDREH